MGVNIFPDGYQVAPDWYHMGAIFARLIPQWCQSGDTYGQCLHVCGALWCQSRSAWYTLVSYGIDA
eukprot:2552912-Pyramimonas_sp.AAC.1